MYNKGSDSFYKPLKYYKSDVEEHTYSPSNRIKCGRVISFREDLLEELEAEITAATGFRIVNHEVKLYGYCIECGGELIEEKRE